MDDKTLDGQVATIALLLGDLSKAEVDRAREMFARGEHMRVVYNALAKDRPQTRRPRRGWAAA